MKLRLPCYTGAFERCFGQRRFIAEPFARRPCIADRSDGGRKGFTLLEWGGEFAFRFGGCMRSGCFLVFVDLRYGTGHIRAGLRREEGYLVTVFMFFPVVL